MIHFFLYLIFFACVESLSSIVRCKHNRVDADAANKCSLKTNCSSYPVGYCAKIIDGSFDGYRIYEDVSDKVCETVYIDEDCNFPALDTSCFKYGDCVDIRGVLYTFSDPDGDSVTLPIVLAVAGFLILLISSYITYLVIKRERDKWSSDEATIEEGAKPQFDEPCEKLNNRHSQFHVIKEDKIDDKMSDLLFCKNEIPLDTFADTQDHSTCITENISILHNASNIKDQHSSDYLKSRLILVDEVGLSISRAVPCCKVDDNSDSEHSNIEILNEKCCEIPDSNSCCSLHQINSFDHCSSRSCSSYDDEMSSTFHSDNFYIARGANQALDYMRNQWYLSVKHSNEASNAGLHSFGERSPSINSDQQITLNELYEIGENLVENQMLFETKLRDAVIVPQTFDYDTATRDIASAKTYELSAEDISNIDNSVNRVSNCAHSLFSQPMPVQEYPYHSNLQRNVCLANLPPCYYSSHDNLVPFEQDFESKHVKNTEHWCEKQFNVNEFCDKPLNQQYGYERVCYGNGNNNLHPQINFNMSPSTFKIRIAHAHLHDNNNVNPVNMLNLDYVNKIVNNNNIQVGDSRSSIASTYISCPSAHTTAHLLKSVPESSSVESYPSSHLSANFDSISDPAVPITLPAVGQCPISQQDIS